MISISLNFLRFLDELSVQEQEIKHSSDSPKIFPPMSPISPVSEEKIEQSTTSVPLEPEPVIPDLVELDTVNPTPSKSDGIRAARAKYFSNPTTQSPVRDTENRSHMEGTFSKATMIPSKEIEKKSENQEDTAADRLGLMSVSFQEPQQPAEAPVKVAGEGEENS